MAKVWVLDTETKGTGAQVVPLERVQKPATPTPLSVVRKAKPKPRPPAPERKPPARFRVVDVMTHERLADDADARATVDVLERVRSVVDVHVYVWEPKTDGWRLLTYGEQQRLWGLRGRRQRVGAP